MSAHPNTSSFDGETDDSALGEAARLLRAVVDLCESAGGAKTERGQELLEGVFLDLVARAERDIRIHLSERLAAATWAPPGLINALALDDIDIARPVIARSPVLKDRDLIFLLAAATLDHQIAIARRPGLGEEVVKAILDQADPVVLTALAGNETADVSAASMSRLVAYSERLVALRGPLSRHPALTVELAGALYRWVGKTLRAELAGRFEVDPGALESAVRAAVDASLAGVGAPAPRLSADPEEMERKLVAKLQASGQLRPGFLLRALRQEKLGLFVTALSSLSDVRAEDVRLLLDSDRPDLLAHLCRSVGIDRTVFPTLLGLVRSLNASRPLAAMGTEARIAQVWSVESLEISRERCRAGLEELKALRAA